MPIYVCRHKGTKELFCGFYALQGKATPFWVSANEPEYSSRGVALNSTPEPETIADLKKMGIEAEWCEVIIKEPS